MKKNVKVWLHGQRCLTAVTAVTICFGLGVAYACVASADPISPNASTTTTRPAMSPEVRDRLMQNVRKDPAAPTTTIPSASDMVVPPPDPVAKTNTYYYIVPGQTSARVEVVDTASGRVLETIDPEGGATDSWGQSMVDVVTLRDVAEWYVYNVDVDLWIAPEQSGDVDTWAFGARAMSGYVWYCGFQVSFGGNPSQDLFGFHAGIAMGNGDSPGIPNRWHGSWGGYYGNQYPDPSKRNKVFPGSPKGTQYEFQANHWYTVRVWRLGQSGSSWRWGAWIIDPGNGETFLGEFSLPGAQMISNAVYWSELDEINVGATDFVGMHNQLSYYRQVGANSPQDFIRASSFYGPVVTNTDLRCDNTNLRYTVDSREVQRLHPPTTLWNYYP